MGNPTLTSTTATRRVLPQEFCFSFFPQFAFPYFGVVSIMIFNSPSLRTCYVMIGHRSYSRESSCDMPSKPHRSPFHCDFGHTWGRLWCTVMFTLELMDTFRTDVPDNRVCVTVWYWQDIGFFAWRPVHFRSFTYHNGHCNFNPDFFRCVFLVNALQADTVLFGGGHFVSHFGQSGIYLPPISHLQRPSPCLISFPVMDSPKKQSVSFAYPAMPLPVSGCWLPTS